MICFADTFPKIRRTYKLKCGVKALSPKPNLQETYFSDLTSGL